MRGLSIGRAFVLALLGLTLALTVIAGVGIARLYHARERYESRLGAAYALEAAGERLRAAAIGEEAVLRGGRRGEAEARRAFDAAATRALALARGDAASRRLLDRAIAAEHRLRRAPRTASPTAARPALAALSSRQAARREHAREKASADSRKAIVVVAVVGGLAVAAALALVGALLAGVRRPLDALAGAAGRLAAGDTGTRVREDGPGEVAQLARAFNAMAAEIERGHRAVEEERRTLAVTIESLGDALVVIGDDGRVSAANPRAAELVPEAAVGAPLRATGLPDPVDALAGEVIVERARRTLAVTAARMGTDRRGLVWTVRDVSDRLRLERLKSEFLATASHELRSPLTSIKGFVELLHASSDLSDRQREWVRIVLVSANRLVDLVNDLLDVARIEAGRADIHRRPTDVGEAVHEVAVLLGPRIADRGQRLHVDVPQGLPRAMADPARLRQVITNLLTNAHQYTDVHGVLTVRLDATPYTVTIAISDTGRGMSPEQLDHVFDRFYRGGEGGTGLGLAIVRSLVDLQGGTISVTSREGAGTTFTVRLPRVPEAERRPDVAGRRVRVVAAEPGAAALAARLEPYGIVAETGADGPADALALDVLSPGAFAALARAPEGLPVAPVALLANDRALAGERAVPRALDPDELADALGAAVVAGRVSALGIATPAARPAVEEAVRALGIEVAWAADAAQATRLCDERRFEVALIDVALPGARAATGALRLRGRRLRPAVIVFSTAGLARLDAEPVALADAGAAVLAVLEAGTERDASH